MGKKFKSGYTLTELAVVIAFVSILLMTIAVVTLNLVNVYAKGSTLKKINTIGLDLIDEFKEAVSASPSFDYKSKCSKWTNSSEVNSCENDKGLKFIFQEYTNDDITSGDNKIKKLGGVLDDSVQNYGVFCTGQYTYVWNSGYVLGSGESLSSGLYFGGEKFDNQTFKLRKYSDQGGNICNGNLNNDHYKIDSIKTYISSTSLVDELITTKDIAIYSFKVDSPVQIEGSSKGTILTMHLVLGSITGGVNIENDYAGCDQKSVADLSTYDSSHCAAYQFNFSQTIQNGQ